MSNSEQNLKDKIACYEEWMKGDHVLVHLDSRQESVQVPAQLKDNPSLTLKVSYMFQGEIKHDSEAISVYLKFSGQYQLCVLPWSAIWGLSGPESQQKIWTSDLPQEVLKDLAKSRIKEIGSRLFSKRKPVEDEPQAAERGPSEAERPALKIVDKHKEKKSPPFLKRIK